MLSKTCQHGIKAMICITKKATAANPLSVATVAAKINVPLAFTSKVLQRLVKAGILTSKKGTKGGFYVDKHLVEKLTVWDIVSELDGGDLKYGCILGLEECSHRNPCPAHDNYAAVRGQLIDFLEKTSLHELAEKLKDGGSNIVLQFISI